MDSSGSGLRDRITLGILICEYAVIVALLWALSLEYQSNAFMRSWITQNASPVGYLLNGYFAALTLGILLGSLGIYFERVLRRKNKSSGPT